MTRSSASIPFSARSAARGLVRRARVAAEDAEDRLPSLDRRERWLRDEKYQIERRGQTALATPGLTAEAQTEIRERTEAELRDWQTQTTELAALHVTLVETQRETSSRFKRLRSQAESSEGLAPWDAAALEALRAWGDLPPTPQAAQAMLKGSDVETLFRERLRVARSTYYSQMRPLLRSYYLVAPELVMYTDGSARLHPGKSMRFRREEVDAVIAFIEAESAML